MLGDEKLRVLLHMGDPYVVDNPCTKRMRAFKNELEKQGHEVYILAPGNGKEPTVSGVIFCKTPELKKKTSFYRLMNGLGCAMSSIREAGKLGKIDIVLTTCPPPLINIAGWYIAKRKHAKLIYDVRDIWPDVALEMGSFSEGSIYCRLFIFIRDFMLKRADLVTAVSKGKVDKLKGYASDKEVICIPNGFDNNFLQNEINQELYKELEIIEGFKCIYVGNLGLAQGLSQLLGIAKKAKEQNLDAKFLLYGSGAEEKLLKDFANENGLDNVFFQGRLPNKDMFTVLNVADISFVPLVNENLKDSIPTKLYESLGAGCPVLLAAEGDSAEVLNATRYGIAVSPNDSEGLWNAFMNLYQNRGTFDKWRVTAVDLMKNQYSLQESAKAIYEEMINL